MSIKKNPADLTMRDIGTATGDGIKWGMKKFLSLGIKAANKAKELSKEALEEAKKEHEKDDTAIEVKATVVETEEGK